MHFIVCADFISKEYFMRKFNLGDNTIIFDEQFDILNSFRKEFKLLGKNIKNQYLDMVDYLYTDGLQIDLEILVDDIPCLIEEIAIIPSVSLAVKLLVSSDIYDYDAERFENKYYDDYFNAYTGDGYYQIAETYDNLVFNYEALQRSKSYNRSTRSYWEGGGFGLGGAIKGALTAGALNLTTDIIRSVGDGIRDHSDKNKYDEQKNNFLRNGSLWDLLWEDIDACIFGVYKALVQQYKESKNLSILWENPDHIEHSMAIIRNIQDFINDSHEVIKLLCRAINIYPYHKDYFTFLNELDDVNSATVKELAEYLGYGYLYTKNETISFDSIETQTANSIIVPTEIYISEPAENTSIDSSIIKNQSIPTDVLSTLSIDKSGNNDTEKKEKPQQIKPEYIKPSPVLNNTHKIKYQIRFCGECGSKLSGNENFCGECGAPIG